MAKQEKIIKEAFIAYMMLNGMPKKEAEEISEWFLFEAGPKGRWEASTEGTDYRVCSVCNYTKHAGIKYNYCPMCGADMRGEE